MRTALLVLLVLSPRLHAGPAPRQNKPIAPPQPYALTYAQQMLSVATQVSAGYIRPVSRTDILRAGVAGMFEAARQPFPPSLAEKIRHSASDQAVLEVLAHARESLGECEALQDHA